KPALEQALQGFNASVFAYGQTGSGKTHTMMGTEGEPGVIMRVCEGLFTPEFEGWSVEMSFLEI
ncbi:P-loop containing nucleoside triphosphate hydrolase protein, partial [Pavlovales sp. CCMP2436]